MTALRNRDKSLVMPGAAEGSGIAPLFLCSAALLITLTHVTLGALTSMEGFEELRMACSTKCG